MENLIFAFAITVFIAMYGGLHFYLYRKLRIVFPSFRRVIITSLVILGCSIFVVEILTHGNIQAFFAVPLSWLTFTWMGLVFLFFMVSMPLDLIQKIAGIAGSATIRVRLASPHRTLAVMVTVVVIAGYGFVAARQINVERINLESAKLQGTIRVVQVADLHLGLLSDERHISRIVDAINALEPDLIVSTGDLVDMQLDQLQVLVEQMQRLQSRWGKLAVSGNHEFLAGIDAARGFTERAGFIMLSDTGVTVNDALNVVGVEDQSIERRKQGPAVDESELLGKFNNQHFTLLLKHQPVIEASSIGYFDLQLSGHIHGGQIFPFGLLTWAFYRVPLGLSRAGENGWIYVSRGTGTWGPPLRVLAPPEITLIELSPISSNQ
ncbi:metallophosphoesterase [Kaarinaea lacus]